jgi:hypothetical protein
VRAQAGWKALLHPAAEFLKDEAVAIRSRGSRRICRQSASRSCTVFLVLAHERRRIHHFNVTAHPTAEWTAQQLPEAFSFDTPRHLLRDRDGIFSSEFQKDVKAIGFEEAPSAPGLPWKRAYVERACLP